LFFGTGLIGGCLMLGCFDHFDDACDLFAGHTLHGVGRARSLILGDMQSVISPG
jgi:hypothetical protein